MATDCSRAAAFFLLVSCANYGGRTLVEDRGPLPRYTLREALGHKDLPVGEVLPRSPAASPDARRVLYWTVSGPSVLDSSAAILSASSCGSWSPVLPVFSPSGDQLLCGGQPPILFTVADRSIQNLPDTHSFSWRAVRWNRTGAQAVVLQVDRVDLVTVATGKVRSLYASNRVSLDLAEAAISDDAGRVAFWETECLHSESLLECRPGPLESRLKVVEVSSGRAATVASGAAGPGPIAFSDDGLRVAYLFDAALHVRPVP